VMNLHGCEGSVSMMCTAGATYPLQRGQIFRHVSSIELSIRAHKLFLDFFATWHATVPEDAMSRVLGAQRRPRKHAAPGRS
jgi:hypothetical protein